MKDKSCDKLERTLVDAWLTCKNARYNSTLRIDMPVLTSIASFTSSPARISQLTIPTTDNRPANRFERILPSDGYPGQFYTGPPGNNPAVCDRVPMMDEYLNKVIQFTDRYNNVPGFSNYITGEVTTSGKGLINNYSGAYHQMRDMTQPGYAAGNVVRLEGDFAASLSGITPVCTGCTYDVQLTGGLLVDYKSYNCTTKIDPKLTGQFAQYLQYWNNAPGTPANQVRTIQFIFNSEKLGANPLDEAKKKFVAVFKSNPQAFFAINPAFFQTAGIGNGLILQAEVNSQNVNLNQALFDFITVKP
jgi:hypothetical protein